MADKDVKRCPNFIMGGAIFKKQLRQSDITWDELIGQMAAKGYYGYSHTKIHRMTKSRNFELDPDEMQALVDALNTKKK